MDFWKSFGASLLAIVVSIGAFFFLTTMLIVGIAAAINSEVETVSEESILYIDLNENIIDAPATSLLGNVDPMAMTIDEPMTLIRVMQAIESAAKDDNIKGICINIDGAGVVSAANLEEMRTAIERFKQSGKFVVAYDDNYTQSEYYLASVADEVWLNPEGSLEWSGMVVSAEFYKGLLDKLDVEVEVFRPTDCRFKSGVEPFILTKMSDANRLQMQSLVDSMWKCFVDDVAASRELSPELLMKYAEELAMTLPEDALTAGLIDRIAYEDELNELYDSYGVERNSNKLHTKISLAKYASMLNPSTKSVSVGNNEAISLENNPLVAIIYADGEIVDGNMYTDGQVYGSRLAAELRQARLCDKTKAVVLRVNSPGGSALASEVAWREMELLQEVKPVVVSMGSMAASGGYYISAPADYIIADKLTLTGSIGVFGVLFNLENTLKNKLGITFDNAATSPSAGGMNMLRPLTDKERKNITRSIDQVYTTFTSHVAEGRNMPIEDVLKIAEGRVWSGTEALECGLIDAIGGFNEAVGKALELADIDGDYTIYEFTAPLTPFEEWLTGTGMISAKAWGVDYNANAEVINNIITEIPMVFNNHGIQAIVAGDLHIKF